MTKPIVAGLFLMLFLSCSVQKQAQQSPASAEINRLLASFSQRLEEDVQRDKTGSISAAVFIGDKIVWSNTFGSADPERGIAADTGTVYRTASISKTITAYLMIRLVQNGTISLDDPIEKFLPEIQQLQPSEYSGKGSITFRNLTNHTSGLPREPKLPNAASGPIAEWETKVLQSISTMALASVPGEKYYYSNIGYGILGLALSRAAGKPFIPLVKELVFDPLGMHNSFFIIPGGKANQVAAGHSIDAFTGETDLERPRAEHAGRGYKVPNGGIYSTPNDLARFLMAQCGNSNLLTEENRQQMQTIQTPGSKDYGYGFGFVIRKNDKGITMLEHDGGVAGYEANMVFNPETRIGVVLMRNYDFGLTNILLEPRTLLSELVKAKKK